MPKLVDYAGRFEFLRQAAHAVVRDEGVAGLSRRAVAVRLELAPATVRRAVDGSASLEVLAADEVRRARRESWWTAPYGDPLGAGPVDRALHALRTLLPSPPAMEHELVWWRLVLAQPSLSQRAAGAAREAARVRHTEDNEEWYAELDLADRRRVAEGRWQPPTVRQDPSPAPDADPLDRHVEEQEADRCAAIDRALDHCGLPPDGRAHHAHVLDALLTGLVLAHCRGRIDPASAREVVARHLSGLLPEPR